VHFVRNVRSRQPGSTSDGARTHQRGVRARESAKAGCKQWDVVADQLASKFPKLAVMLGDAKHDVLAFMSLLKAHRASHPAEAQSQLSAALHAIRRPPRRSVIATRYGRRISSTGGSSLTHQMSSGSLTSCTLRHGIGSCTGRRFSTFSVVVSSDGRWPMICGKNSSSMHSTWRSIDVNHSCNSPFRSRLVNRPRLRSRSVAAGIRLSMGSRGDCYDDAMCESFNATLECELPVKNRSRTQRATEAAIFEFIEAWCDPHRRHSSLVYLSPIGFER